MCSSDLSDPFPHVAPWNDLSLQPDDDLDDEDEYERQLVAFESLYWSSDEVNGAIAISHIGCALRIWLVVSGSEAGHLWRDDRADFQGLYPLSAADGGRLSYVSWYTEWLREAIQQIP